MTSSSFREIANLIVAYNGGPASQSALDFSVTLAARNGAHLTGLLAHGSSRISRNIPNWFAEDLRDRIMSVLADRAVEIRDGFRQRVANAVPADRLHWLEVGGDPDTTVADYSRMYDFTIVGQYENLPEADELVLHPAQIAFGSGRPVIVVPKANRARRLDGHAVIAWDGMRSITGTVADAMPLLREASRVTVLTVENPSTGTPLQGIDIRTMLARHGIGCEWIKVNQGLDHTADLILSWCVEHDADLLLMGVSSHGWVGRMVAGNVAEQIMERTEIPLLMSQ